MATTRRVPLLLVVPTVVILIVALGYPVGWQIVTSFQEFGLAQQFGQPPEWVGIENYRALVNDPALWAVIVRSIVFCIVCALTTVVLGVAIALLMRRVSRAPRLVLQVSLLVAWAMPVVASMTVWAWIVDWRRGLLNWFLVNIGIEDAAGHNWLAEPLSFFTIAAVIVIWMSVPFVALSIYAGPHPDLAGGAGGGRDRRRHPGGSASATSCCRSSRRSSRSSCSSSSSGTCGCSPRSSCSRTPAGSRTRRTCWAPTSTRSAPAPVTSACRAPSPS